MLEAEESGRILRITTTSRAGHEAEQKQSQATIASPQTAGPDKEGLYIQILITCTGAAF